jgi:hypothetical protein
MTIAPSEVPKTKSTSTDPMARQSAAHADLIRVENDAQKLGIFPTLPL